MWWMAVLVACGGPVDVEATRDACGLGPDTVEAVGLDGDHTPTVSLSGPCVEALAGDAALDATAWGFAGAPVTSAATDRDRVLLALYFGLAADLGSVGELRAPGGAPDWLRDRALRSTTPDNAPASRVVYPAVLDRVRRLRRDDTLPLAAERTPAGVTFGPASHRPIEPVELWALLAHEASHGRVPDHVPCAGTRDPHCDRDAHGALGTAAFIGWAWRGPARVAGPLGDRWGHAAARARDPCTRIEQREDAAWCRTD